MRLPLAKLIIGTMLLTLVFPAACAEEYDVDQEFAPPHGRLGAVPIAKIDGPIEFSLLSTGRYVNVMLAAHPKQRSNLNITTALTDSSCTFGFDPTYDPLPPPHLGFDIDGDRILLMFAYAGDTASYRLTRAVDTAGAAVLNVSVERTAHFIKYSPPRISPDRPKRRLR